MSRLAATDAAAALGVDPATLASWGERYGFPTPCREQESYYEASEIEALREAVLSEHSLSRAIETARRATGPTGARGPSASRPIPGLAPLSPTVPLRERPPSQYMTTAPPRSRMPSAVMNASSSWWPRRTGNTPPWV